MKLICCGLNSQYDDMIGHGVMICFEICFDMEVKSAAVWIEQVIMRRSGMLGGVHCGPRVRPHTS